MTTNTEDTPRKKRKMGISASSYGQFIDCERKWYIGYVIKPEVEKTPALQMGIDVHNWLEAYLKGEEPPDIGEKLVNIAKAGLEYLPEPGTVNVEEWVEDVCGPLPFRGKVDFYTCEDGVLHISDHKTTGRIGNAKTQDQLAINPQMLAYAYVLARKLGEQPKAVKFTHIYYLTKSKIPTSFVVNAEASWSDVEKNWHDFERVAKIMSRLAKAQRQEAITPDVRACRFCWYKQHCTAYEKPPSRAKKTKPEAKPETKQKTVAGDDMSILERIKEQKRKQAAAKAELAKLEQEAAAAVAEAKPVAIDHPKAPEPKIDWAALSRLVKTALVGHTDGMPEDRFMDFLEFHLGREVRASDVTNVMASCNGGQLMRAVGGVVTFVKGAAVVEEEEEEESETPPENLSAFLEMVEGAEDPQPSDKIKPRWEEGAKPFIRRALMQLGSIETIPEGEAKDIAKVAAGALRRPRDAAMDSLLEYANRIGIPLRKGSHDYSISLGVSAHEQEMADKLGAQLASPEPEPEKVEEPQHAPLYRPDQLIPRAFKTHLKPVGKIAEDVVVTTTPAVEEPKPLTPVIVYVNAFPSDHIPTKLSDVLAPLQDEVAEEKGVLYYGLVSYNQGPKLVASKLLSLLRECHASEVLGKSCFASQKDPCLAEVLPLLERRDDIVIVRGFIG